MNGFYFDTERSLQVNGRDIAAGLQTIANRYMANNPVKLLVPRAYHEDSFQRNFEGRYLFDFQTKYPKAQEGEYAYAFAYAYLDKEWLANMSFRSNSPAWVYINGEEAFKTAPADEGFYEAKRQVIRYKQGINTFFIKCRKNVLGFGCEFGPAMVQHGELAFLNPLSECEGMLGWAYTLPSKTDVYASVEDQPSVGCESDALWLPQRNLAGLTIDEVLGKGCGYGYAVTFLKNRGYKKIYIFKGSSKLSCRIFIDGKECFEGCGEISFSKELGSGMHQIAVQITYTEEECSEFCLATDEDFSLSEQIWGSKGDWLYIGKTTAPEESILQNFDLYRVYDGIAGKCYLKTDEENISVRLSSETENFGKWTYPIGVVLYGLYEAAKETGNTTAMEYVRAHIRQCTDSYEYALWDTSRYGRAGLDFQLMMLNALDYCGSCGNAMLNALGYEEKTAKVLADVIADYMQHKQERLDNGMFYREMSHSYQRNSIWADDLYMSVPFLCRYYKATGEGAFLEDAVTQFKGFKEYLYMPEKKYMSHVYSLNYAKKSEIPWGRGNGWVVFALSELLSVCPREHADYSFLLDFFRELCEGYLALQDENGLWHQVIDEPDSYYESSCSCMFVCAFARGIVNGWLTEDKFAVAAVKGWEALCTYCLDNQGNLYGVCVGSGMSFRRDYYVKELGWNLNDTHGTGIALLAGVEVLRMQKK